MAVITAVATFALLLGRKHLWLVAAVLIATAFVAAFTLTRWISGWQKKRLAAFPTFATRLASGDLTARINDAGSDPVAEIAYALDTAAARLKRSFHALQTSHSELETLLDSMQEAVVAVDANGRIQWTNRAMQSVMVGPGAASSVRVGHALVQTIRDPDVLLCVTRTLEQKTVSEGKASSVVPGRTFEVSAAPTPGGGAVAVLHDISEVERVETTRRDFIANVSHELRTPLTSISGYVETLLDHLDTSSEEDAGDAEDGAEHRQNVRPFAPHVREFLQIILKNATRMNRLTEDLLALARVESGEHKLRPVPQPAASLVKDAVASLAGVAEDMNVEIVRGELSEREVMADYDAIQQVLANLIENAIKYGRPRGVQAAGRVVVSAVQDEAGLVSFRVQDFGPGIAYEHLDRIFERFYRVDKARSKESGGTGLGLAIAKHIVMAHGGTIRVESQLNLGTTFCFTLPVAPGAADSAPAV